MDIKIFFNFDYKVKGKKFKIIKDYNFIYFFMYNCYLFSLNFLILSLMIFRVFCFRLFLGIF